MAELDPRLHFVATTAIIAKKDADGIVKFLIAKRSPTEKAFPDKWTVPGGKMVYTEYNHLPVSSPDPSQWYNVIEYVVRKEVREEVGLEIEKPVYLTDLVFVHPDGYPVVTISYWAWYQSGEVKLNHEMSDFALVTAAEAEKYDLIKGIAGEIEEAERLLNK
jgi:8-oxo-dGTP pyrophosphatase MutT (NUDIX family)